MITLNDYLYSGDTVLKILMKYSEDLKESSRVNKNQIDLAHSNFLIQIMEILEHNEFLTSQSQRIREFYIYLAKQYPYLAFTFKGRIKSLVRAEAKFNGYIVEYIYDYYAEHGTFPSIPEIKAQISYFRDLIAYRIVISLPKCHLQPGQDRREEELKLLYEIAEALPEFLEERGFSAELAGLDESKLSSRLSSAVAPYYRDYVEHKRPLGYESLHITLYDNQARCFTEVQLRTKEMDDYAEIGKANHTAYEEKQEAERTVKPNVPKGVCNWYDEACERVAMLQNLELKDVEVDMFSAVNNMLINDGCGLFRGRQITPFEHLSRFQKDFED